MERIAVCNYHNWGALQQDNYTNLPPKLIIDLLQYNSLLELVSTS